MELVSRMYLADVSSVKEARYFNATLKGSLAHSFCNVILYTAYRISDINISIKITGL
jgi:hypothetical protein